MTVVSGDLAIVLSATVFAGKKFSGIVSFLIFLLLDYIASKVLNILPDLGDMMAQYIMIIGVSFVMVIVMYVATGWIMERKLSV